MLQFNRKIYIRRISYHRSKQLTRLRFAGTCKQEVIRGFPCYFKNKVYSREEYKIYVMMIALDKKRSLGFKNITFKCMCLSHLYKQKRCLLSFKCQLQG